MTKAVDAANTLWNDRYIAYIPLLGAAVALTFDVGFFYSIGISFFTLFSLSEHIVFAIQAFPIALFLLIGFSTVPIMMGRGGGSVPSPYDPEKVSKPRRIAAYVFLFVLFLIAISVLAYLLVRAPEMILVTMEFAAIGFGIFFMNKPYTRVFITSMVILTILTISFIFGLADGRAYVSKDDRTNGLVPTASNVVQLKDGALIGGRIIRSGDRGVLLYDPASDRLRFVLWNTIDTIEATPQKSP
jgi:hypothetical protein